MIARTYGARALLLVRARTAAPTVRGGKTYAFKFSFHLLMKKIVIAIDGHSSCGKSTMAKALARRVGYIYVDSGAMYRAVTLYALRRGLFAPDGSLQTETLREQMPQIEVSFRLDPDTQLPQTYLNGECVEDAIRSLEVSNHVSPVAALPFVREAMTAQQQAMGRAKGIVMDGRDIGTAVFPDA